MHRILPLALAFCQYAYAQAPPNPTAPLQLTFQQALERAQKYSQQSLSANIDALLAHEDAVQAKAALYPQVNGLSQYIYTQGNGTPSGIFVPNDGVHVYNDYVTAHADIYAPAKRLDYHRAMAAEAAARARIDIAARGLLATVIQDYYAMVAAERKLRNAGLAVADAQSFLDITQKQEAGGEVAHADTVKAHLQLVDRQRDQQEAQLALDPGGARPPSNRPQRLRREHLSAPYGRHVGVAPIRARQWEHLRPPSTGSSRAPKFQVRRSPGIPLSKRNAGPAQRRRWGRACSCPYGVRF